MSTIHTYRSAAIAGAKNAARKSREEQAYEQGAAAATRNAAARDNFVSRVKLDGGVGGSKLTLPPAPALERFIDPATREAFVLETEARERATLDAIGALAAEQLGDAACAAEGERITGTPSSQAAAAVKVARARLDAAQVVEAVAQHEASAAQSRQRAAQREAAARKQAEPVAPPPPVARVEAAPASFSGFLKKLAGLAVESAGTP